MKKIEVLKALKTKAL